MFGNLMLSFLFFFFFSSRRRHTRFDCDWSSDVCSSDLLIEQLVHLALALVERRPLLRGRGAVALRDVRPDRKSTRLNSSHSQISYAVFCLKKKKKNAIPPNTECTSWPTPLRSPFTIMFH